MLLAALAGMAGACSTAPGSSSASTTLPAWPHENPRVRLDRVLATRGDVRPRGISDWLMGRRGEPLFERPFGVAWLGNDLVISDPGARRVVLVGTSSGVLLSWADLLDAPTGVAACRLGVLVTDARLGRVAIFDHRLRFLRWLADGLERPTGIACIGDSVLVVETGAHRVAVLNSEGARRTFGRRGSDPGEFNFPASIAVAPGAVWVGDTLNFRLQRFDPATYVPTAWFGRLGDAPGEMPRTKGLAVAADGVLWVTDGSLDVVALYRPDGTFLMDLGRSGHAPGEFAFPAGIAAHSDGRVAVVDSLNRRVQVFRAIPAGGSS